MSHSPDLDMNIETAQALNTFEYASAAPIVLVSVNSVFQAWQSEATNPGERLRRLTNPMEEAFEVSGIEELIEELEGRDSSLAVTYEVGEKASMHNLHINIAPELSTSEAMKMLTLLLIKGDLYGQFDKGKDPAILSVVASGVELDEGLINFVIHSPTEGVPTWDLNIILSLLDTHSIPFSISDESVVSEESRISLGGDLYSDGEGLIYLSDRVALIPEVPDFWYPNLARGLPYYIQIALRKTARWEFMNSEDFQESVLAHTQRIVNDLGQLFLERLNYTGPYWTRLGVGLELYLRTLTLTLIHDVGEGFSEYGDIDATDSDFQVKKVDANEAERAIIIGLIMNGHLPLFPVHGESKRYWLHTVLEVRDGGSPILRRARHENRFGRIRGDRLETARIAEGLFSHDEETSLEMEFLHLVDKVAGNVFAHKNLDWKSVIDGEVNSLTLGKLKGLRSREEMGEALKGLDISITNDSEIKAKVNRVGKAVKNFHAAFVREYSFLPQYVVTKMTEDVCRGVFWYLTSSYHDVKSGTNSADGYYAALISEIFYLEMIEKFEEEGSTELGSLLRRFLDGNL